MAPRITWQTMLVWLIGIALFFFLVVARARSNTARIDTITCDLYARYTAGQLPDEVAAHLYYLRSEAHRAAIRAEYAPSEWNRAVAAMTLARFEQATKGIAE